MPLTVPWIQVDARTNRSECSGGGESEVVVTVEVDRRAGTEPLLRAADEPPRPPPGWRCRSCPRRRPPARPPRSPSCRPFRSSRRPPGFRRHRRRQRCRSLFDRKRDRCDDPLEHRLTVNAERFELQVRDRRFDHARADLELKTSAFTSASTAREKPQTSARRPASRISSTARQSSCETRGKPSAIPLRSPACRARVRARACLRDRARPPRYLSPSRSVVS